MQKNSKLPEKFVLSRAPKEYLKQGWSHCGAFSIKGILGAYNKDVEKNPREYHIFWWNRITGAGLYRNYYVDVLKKYGIDADARNANSLYDNQKLTLLKKLLRKNIPVMVLIGNGYLSNGKYSPFRASIISHWLTVWGYNDKEKVFYVYDSCVPKEFYDKGIPIGNKKRTYSEVLRDWKGAIITRFILGWGKNFYIQIEGIKNE